MPGVAGLAKVHGAAIPDPSQFDKKSAYYDATSSKAEPRWLMAQVKFVERFEALVQPMLERCDGEQLPAYLETNSAANLPLYRSRGFEVFHQELIPAGGPMTYFMKRLPLPGTGQAL